MARHRRDDIARPLCIAVRHVLDAADDADGIHFRFARGQRLHQADDAGSARHVALHVFHAGRRLDRNAARVETDALADEGDRRLALLAAVPAHDDDAAVAPRPLTDAEQRAHAELGHRLDVEHLDGDADFFQHLRAAGEFFRIENVGRFVDQIARHQNAAGDRFARHVSLARRRDVASGNGDAALLRRLFVVLALGLVAVESIGAQQHALRQIGGRFGRHFAAGRQFGKDRCIAGAGRQLAQGGTAKFDEVLRLEVGELAGADHGQAVDFQPFRHDQIERFAALACEALGFGGAGDQASGRPQRLGGRGAEFEPVIAKYHQNPPLRCGERAKCNLGGVGHREASLFWSGCVVWSSFGQHAYGAPPAALQSPCRAVLRGFQEFDSQRGPWQKSGGRRYLLARIDPAGLVSRAA